MPAPWRIRSFVYTLNAVTKTRTLRTRLMGKSLIVVAMLGATIAAAGGQTSPAHTANKTGATEIARPLMQHAGAPSWHQRWR